MEARDAAEHPMMYRKASSPCPSPHHPQQRITQSKMSVTSRLRNPALEILSVQAAFANVNNWLAGMTVLSCDARSLEVLG